jgi:hypothetical protein
LPPAENPRQRWLFSYVVMCRFVDELGPFVPELPPDYPDRRPKLFAFCQSIGLGDRWPCTFGTCRHSLLADEDTPGGETMPDADLWTVETCSLAVAARGRHTAAEVGRLFGLCESSIEEFTRRAEGNLLSGLDCDELVEIHRGQLRRARPAGGRLVRFKFDKCGMDGLHHLVERRWKAGISVNSPPVRKLSAAEVRKLYPGAKLSPAFGRPRAEKPPEREQVPSWLESQDD